MDDDLRSDIAAAVEAAPESAIESATAVEAPAPAEAGDAKPATGTVRDALGRFVDKAPAAEPDATKEAPQGAVEATQAPAGEEVAAAVAATPETPTVKAPTSWNAQEREHWAGVPVAAQHAVMRREAQINEALRTSAESRGLAESFQRAVQPFMPAIQAEGVDPITAVTNLMQVGSRLRFGTPGEKAQTIAQLVQAYAVDIQALDGALVGNVQPAQPQPMADPRFDQLMAMAQQRAAQTQREVRTRTEAELAEFEQGHEFFNDLRGTMADVLDVADRQGRPMSLADAYERAALLHPEVSKIMIARRQGETAKALTAASTKAKAAAVGIRGGAPVGKPNGPEPDTLRDAIRSSYESLSRV